MSKSNCESHGDFQWPRSRQGETTPASTKSLADDKQVQEEMREHDLRFWIEKLLALSFYYYDETVGTIKGFSQQEIDFRLLQQAKEFGPLTQLRTSEKMQRFNEVMNNFLGGSGRTLYFKMADHLNSCAGARHRVSQAISFRLARDTDLIYGNSILGLSPATAASISEQRQACALFGLSVSDPSE